MSTAARSLEPSPIIKPTRDGSLDFTKGVLVLVMILFHSLQYFVADEFKPLNYLAFVTGAFVFLSGCWIMESSRSDNGVTLQPRSQDLIRRGFKLLTLFVVLNIPLYWIRSHRDSDPAFSTAIGFDQLGSVFISGNKALVAYEMLIPIAYTLMAAALYGWFLKTKMVFLITAITAAWIMNQFLSERFNFQYLALGHLGMGVGILRSNQLCPEGLKKIWYGVSAGLLTYVLTITFLPKDTPWIYAGGVIAVVEFIRTSHQLTWIPHWVSWPVAILGQYSLLGYLSQIVLLRSIQTVAPQGQVSSLGLAIILIFSTGFILLLSLVVDRTRRISGWFNRLYRFVF